MTDPLPQQRVVVLPIDEVVPMVAQPRSYFDEARLRALAASIDENGQWTPVDVRPLRRRAGKAKFELIEGERRWRAVKHYCSKVRTLKAIVHEDVREPFKAFEAAFLANEQREDLHPVERAEAMQRLIDEGGYTHERLAKMVGRSTAWVSFAVSINKLHPKVKAMLDPARPEKDRLSFSAAVQIARLPQKVQLGVAAVALARGGKMADVQALTLKAQNEHGFAQRARLGDAMRHLVTNLERLDRVLLRRYGEETVVFQALDRATPGTRDAAVALAKSLIQRLGVLVARLEARG